MMIEESNINFFPFLNDLKKYRLPSFRRDLMAALSVALLAIPQAMAYAFMAELPPSAGIYAAIFGTIFAAAFGASPYLVSGPSNTIAILIQSGTSDILYTYYPTVTGSAKETLALQIVLQIVFIVGIAQIVGGLLNLGRLTQFPSRSAIMGYLVGASFAIAISQLFYFFGIPEMVGNYPLYEQGWFLLTNLTKLHVPTALLALACLLLLIFIPRFNQKLPAALIVFFLASLLVAIFHLSPIEKSGSFDVMPGQKIQKITLLEDIGPFNADLPHFSFPPFNMKLLGKIVPLAFAITLFSALEATAIGRACASSKDPIYSDNQEVFGLGISNFFSAFLGAMPSSGSFSRTLVNINYGAQTRFASILSGIFVLLFTLTIGFLVTKIPLPALSALLLLTAYSMVNYKDLLLCLKATRADAFVVIITFISSMLFTLDVALYIGVAVSIVLFLKKATTPHLIEYTFNSIGKLRAMDAEDARPDPRICILHVEGELFFGAADALQSSLAKVLEDESIKVIILQVMNARYVDASICLIIKRFYHYLQHRRGHLLISGMTEDVKRVIEDAGLIEVLGKKNLFAANEQLPSEPTRKAYAFAKSLISNE